MVVPGRVSLQGSDGVVKGRLLIVNDHESAYQRGTKHARQEVWSKSSGNTGTHDVTQENIE
jgi:hypothetical protein